MPRKTKIAVIEELNKLGIEFDSNAKYNELVKLLAPEQEPIEEPVKDVVQNCGRCEFYVLDDIKGFNLCIVRGGKRNSTDGKSCDKFKEK